jgi:tetratricopeptide (TPR) repeat protein
LSASDSLLIRGQNALKSGEYDRAIDTYGGVGKAPSSGPEQAVEADYYIGEALVDKADYAQALGHFQSVLSTSTAAERWVLPWAHFQSGYCYLKLNDDAAARKEFEKSLDYEDFDFKNWLEYRAKRELDEIKKKSG